MRFKLFSGLALVAGLCLAAVAVAQPQGQPGGRGRGGPPGGGAFGMFGGGGFGTSRLRLLQMDEIRKELELADEQVAAIRTLDEELRAKYPMVGGRGPGGPGGPGGGPGGPGGERGRRGGNNNNEGALRTIPTQWYFVQQEQPGQGRGGRGGPGNFQPPSPEQMAEMEKQRAERDREANAKLAEILLPHQIKRLTEIYVQQAGTGALLDDEVAKQLGISDAQKAEVVKVREANQEAMRNQGREAFTGLDDEARRAKFTEMRKANDDKVLAVLNADQRKKFEAMKGKEFAMPELGRVGAGAPGGGRGGPGGPGGTRGRGGNNN